MSASRPAQPGGAIDFQPSWRSTAGGVTLVLIGLATVAFLVALTGFGGIRWVAAASLVMFAWLAWTSGRALFGTQPVLRIGPRGVKSVLLRGRTIPWADIRDVEAQVVQGHTIVVLHLAPGAESLAKTRGFFTGRKPERRIPLAALRKEERAHAVQALQAAFATHAPGTAHAAREVRMEEARAQLAFETRLEELTPRPWALYAIVAANVGVWLANVASGVAPMAPRASELFAWGANSAWSVLVDGQWWRLITATFLHGGLVHLAFNMIGLWSAGRLLNRLHGNAQFLVIYFASALAGSALSLSFSAQQAVGVGASGAVFGVLGGLLVAVRKHREQIPALLGKSVMTSQGIFMAYSLLQGFTRPNVDNAAHVGGLLAGAAAAWLLVEKIDERHRGLAQRRAAVVAGLALVAVGMLAALAPAPPVDHRRGFAFESVMSTEWPKLQAAHQALSRDAQAHKAGRLTEAQMLEAIETKHLPAFRAVQQALASVSLATSDPRAAVLHDMQQLPALMVSAMDMQVKRARGEVDAASADARTAALGKQLDEITRRLKARTEAATKKQ